MGSRSLFDYYFVYDLRSKELRIKVIKIFMKVKKIMIFFLTVLSFGDIIPFVILEFFTLTINTHSPP